MVKYVDCDIFDMNVDIIGHQVNTYGIMGGGLAREIKERFPDVYTQYRDLCISENDLLGQMYLAYANKNLIIANLFGQDDGRGTSVLTNYPALKKSLRMLHLWATDLGKKTIALPHFLGCGIAGGDWGIVSKLIKDEFETDKDITCYICKLD